MRQINGIDVSKWQGEIDWNKVKASGFEFAIIKVGNGLTNGVLSFDPYFYKNLSGALSAGLRVGGYVYMYATTVRDAENAAEKTVEALSAWKDKITLPLFIDMEEDATANTGKFNCSSMVAAWRDVIRKAGYTAGLYTNPTWLKNFVALPDGCKLWLAHYTKTPYCTSYMWQYTMTGKVDGITTDVDKNILYEEEEPAKKPEKEEAKVEEPKEMLDNTPASWAKEAVEWATENGIMKGDEKGLRLNDPITRQEMCVMLYRALSALK